MKLSFPPFVSLSFQTNFLQPGDEDTVDEYCLS